MLLLLLVTTQYRMFPYPFSHTCAHASIFICTFPLSRFDHVVVASGHYSVPHVPTFPGVEKFPGRVLHAHDFRLSSLLPLFFILCQCCSCCGSLHQKYHHTHHEQHHHHHKHHPHHHHQGCHRVCWKTSLAGRIKLLC